ncbi:MAG: MucR family transcriptional regulator [Hyphomicrobiaceae bacterium]
MENSSNEQLISLTADIVAAYVTKNQVPAGELSALIGQVHSSIASLAAGGPAVKEAPKPAVPVKKSITPDYIICLEDGKKFKSLKRHLGTAYDMSPDEYRQKWGLPADYPMVAPNYAAARSELAKATGLGRKPTAGRAGAAKRKKSA